MRGHIGFKSSRLIYPVRVSYAELNALTFESPSPKVHVSYAEADVFTRSPPANEINFSYFELDMLAHAPLVDGTHLTFVGVDALCHTPSAPIMPDGVQITAITATSVSLSWPAAYASGTTEAPTYTVQYSADDGQTWTTATSTTTVTQFIVTGLTASNVYLFRVQAANSFGTSAWSAASNYAIPSSGGYWNAQKMTLSTSASGLTITVNNSDATDLTIGGTANITTQGQFIFDFIPLDFPSADSNCYSTAQFEDGSNVVECAFTYTFQRRTVVPFLSAWATIQTGPFIGTVNGQSVQWPQSPAIYTHFAGTSPTYTVGYTYDFRCILTTKGTESKGVTPVFRITFT